MKYFFENHCTQFVHHLILRFFLLEIQVRIREMPVLEKLQYLHVLLSSVLPVVKQIHHEQCYEVELEKKLRGKMHSMSSFCLKLL